MKPMIPKDKKNLADAKLEWKQSNTQQNREQLQNPTKGVTINNESKTEPPP